VGADKNDADLLRMFTLIVSIPAVGKITAMHFICYTNEFKTVKSGKQLSAYCGVVPFEHSSGKSLSGSQIASPGKQGLKKHSYTCVQQQLLK
jgi:transposase